MKKKIRSIPLLNGRKPKKMDLINKKLIRVTANMKPNLKALKTHPH